VQWRNSLELRAPQRDPGVVREALARPERELETALELEKRHGAVLEFFADDALGLPAEAVAIEPHRALQVVDA
jgi:hypothetical protein